MNSTQKKSKTKNRKTLFLILGLILVSAILTLVLNLLMGGKTTTTGQQTANEKSVSLVCSSTTATHPKMISTYTSTNSEMKATLVFNGINLKTVGLIYTLYYPNEQDPSGAESMMHADFNISLGKLGLESSAFSNKFNTYENRLIINLFAEEDELNEKTAPYFMINVDDGGQLTDWTVKDYKNNYELQGFSCEQK